MTKQTEKPGFVAFGPQGYAIGYDPDNLEWTTNIENATVYEELVDGTIPETKALTVTVFKTILRSIVPCPKKPKSTT